MDGFPQLNLEVEPLHGLDLRAAALSNRVYLEVMVDYKVNSMLIENAA